MDGAVGRVDVAVFGVEPVVVGVEAGLPAQPGAAALLGQELSLLEAQPEGESLRSVAHQEDVVGVVHHRLGDERRRGEPLERRHRSGAPGGAVHAGGVELYHAVLVGQPAEAHGNVVGIELHQVDAGDRGVEGVGSVVGHEPVGPGHGLEAVGGGDRHGSSRAFLGGWAGLRVLRPVGPICVGERGCGGGAEA